MLTHEYNILTSRQRTAITICLYITFSNNHYAQIINMHLIRLHIKIHNTDTNMASINYRYIVNIHGLRDPIKHEMKQSH